MANLDYRVNDLLGISTRNLKQEILDPKPLIPRPTESQDMDSDYKYSRENFYNLIKAFKDKTKFPILFNTSLNLAGEPLVETLQDALNLLQNSKLKYLYLPEIKKLVIA